MRASSSRARRALGGAICLAAFATAIGACTGWSPLDPFEHNAPEVDEAITSMDAGKYPSAERLLDDYLKTGKCGPGGVVAVPEEILLKPNGSFDLGLTLFKLAERFGRRFGEEEGTGEGPQDKEGRAAEVGCALAIVEAIAHDPKVPLDLRARASFLAGNLRFMQKEYKDAIRSYDEALALVPGLSPDAGGDGIGRDAAHNRAIALRRLEDEQDAGQDASDEQDDGGGGDGGDAGDAGSGQQDASDDGGGKNDGGGDAGDDDDDDPESQGLDAGDAGRDAGSQGPPDAGRDAGSPDDQQGDPQPASPQPGEQQKGARQDDRMLDRLEETPSYQQQEARVRASRRRHTMEDK